MTTALRNNIVIRPIPKPLDSRRTGQMEASPFHFRRWSEIGPVRMRMKTIGVKRHSQRLLQVAQVQGIPTTMTSRAVNLMAETKRVIHTV